MWEGGVVLGGRRLQGAVELIPNFPQQQQSWLQQLTTFPDVIPPPPSSTSSSSTTSFSSPPTPLPHQPFFGSVNTSCRLPGGASGSLSLRSLLANQLRQIQNGWKGFRKQRGEEEEEGGAIQIIPVCVSCHMMVNDNHTSGFNRQSGQRSQMTHGG